MAPREVPPNLYLQRPPNERQGVPRVRRDDSAHQYGDGIRACLRSGSLVELNVARGDLSRDAVAGVLEEVLTLVANSCSCSQGVFEAAEVAGSGAVQGMAVPAGVQPDQVECGRGVGVFEGVLGRPR